MEADAGQSFHAAIADSDCTGNEFRATLTGVVVEKFHAAIADSDRAVWKSQSAVDLVAKLAARRCHLRRDSWLEPMPYPAESDPRLAGCAYPRTLPAEQCGDGGGPTNGGETRDEDMDPSADSTRRPNAYGLLAHWRAKEQSLLQARVQVGRAKAVLDAAERAERTRARALAKAENAVLASGDAEVIALLVDARRIGMEDEETKPGSSAINPDRAGQASKSRRLCVGAPGGNCGGGRADLPDGVEQAKEQRCSR